MAKMQNFKMKLIDYKSFREVLKVHLDDPDGPAFLVADVTTFQKDLQRA
jgi:hypothetical protein